MDLKDVINDVLEKGPEAHSAFHAGHQDVAKNYLDEIRLKIAAYFEVKVTLRNDVTESATSEKSEETLPEKQAAVPGAREWPGAIHSEHDVPQVEQVPESQQETR